MEVERRKRAEWTRVGEGRGGMERMRKVNKWTEEEGEQENREGEGNGGRRW